MVRKTKNKYPVRFSKNNIGDGYRYFNDLYTYAVKLIGSGKRVQGFRMLKKGSRQYYILFKNGYPLSDLIIDDCSCYLANYYERQKRYRQLKRIHERNFVEYQGEFFLLTTHENLAFRLIPLSELDEQGDYDFGIDSPPEQQVSEAVQRLVKKREVCYDYIFTEVQLVLSA